MSENSKTLSYLLRHKPEKAHLTLDKEGWVLINTLLFNLKEYMGIEISHTELLDIVDNNDKKRFSINKDGNKIRAAQGHSVDVSIKMEQKLPPLLLFHGTKEEYLPSIRKHGLLKGTRNHVHLSGTMEIAKQVADRRKGKSIIIAITTHNMIKDGYEFFISENGVWLIDHVPAKYLTYG
jgi:putative RNA 2'-phosphotransferase